MLWVESAYYENGGNKKEILNNTEELHEQQRGTILSTDLNSGNTIDHTERDRHSSGDKIYIMPETMLENTC